MASQIILKNGQDQEFSITHPDNVGAVRIKSNEIATKLELAAKVALADFIETNVSLAANGYQKLPSGLIIQWGVYIKNATQSTITFPIVFPNACVSVHLTPLYSAAVGNIPTLISISATGFVNSSGNYAATYRKPWFAIGY